jgi:hypothetical protein
MDGPVEPGHDSSGEYVIARLDRAIHGQAGAQRRGLWAEVTKTRGRASGGRWRGAGRTNIQLAVDRRVLNRLSIFAADAAEREPNGGRLLVPRPGGPPLELRHHDPWQR